MTKASLVEPAPEPVTASRDGAGARPRRRAWQLAVGLVLAVLGVSVFGATAVAPDTVARIAGSTKVEVQQFARSALRPQYIPQIRLGGEGGMRELHRCSGEFTEMVDYRREGVLPLYAAHNKCGGDIILGWELGQQVKVEGSDIIYEVVEERHTPRWSNVELLVGMRGEFMVQTCYYGENRMRFLALAPVDPQASVDPSTGDASGSEVAQP